MSTEARELIAAILWKAQALSSAPTSIYKRRTPSAFLDAGDKAREPFLIQADAILAALPEIIADMVEPLEWEEHPENGDPVMAKAVTKFGTYFICDDTDDFSGLYCEFITHQDATWFGTVRAKTELLFQYEHEDDHTNLYHIPNAHNRATSLKALGMKEGE